MSKTPVVVVAILLLTGTASAQTTRLFLNSQPGDYIGGGIQQTMTTATGGFTATQNFDGSTQPSRKLVGLAASSSSRKGSGSARS